MLSRLTGKITYQNLIFTGYLGLAAGLPLSKIVLSLSTIWILLFTLLAADFGTYARRFRESRIIQLLFVFLALHLLSFLWSSDMQYALRDLNAKLPLYVIPLIFVVQPPASVKQRYILCGTFLAAMLFTSVFNFGSYLHWWGDRVYDDIRGMSLFLSHIRYALMITMSAAICIVWWQKKLPYKWAGLLSGCWFAFYTYYSQILSGLMTFAGILVVLLILEVIRRKNKWFTFAVCLAGALFIAAAGFALQAFFKPEKLKVSLDDLPLATREGNLYLHYRGDKRLENGYPIYYFLCQEEMEREWNKRSKFPYDSLDGKGQVLEATLIRYITSKGWRKDAEGVNALSAKDVKNIEQGIPTSVKYETGFYQRLRGLRTELLQQSDPNGYSVSQRFEYWKTGIRIIRKHWMLGVGAGDIDQAFQQQYVADRSLLFKENRLRSHNQYISYTISFGIAGLLLFGWLLCSSWRCFYRRNMVLGLLFMTISILSFLVEDTLETQMGVTFFAFFWGLFISSDRKTDRLSTNQVI